MINCRLLDNIITYSEGNNTIKILRGFPKAYIAHFRNRFIDCDLLDEDGRIEAENISSFKTLISITQNKAGVDFLTWESFYNLCETYGDIDSLNKETGVCFRIINNNLLEFIPNPTTSDIPDFNSESFENYSNNSWYDKFYSSCIQENGISKVRLFSLPQSLEDCPYIEWFDLLEPSDLHSIEMSDDSQSIVLTKSSGTLQILMESIVNGQFISSENYLITQEPNEQECYKILQAAIDKYGLPISLKWKTNQPHVSVRQDLKTILNEVWNYPDFRNLRMYRDLFVNHEVTDISQGEIIENVVRQVELAQKNATYSNVLLTSPTGAGKSLLFQLAAIYLADNYGLLTIVISPLVALMDDQVQNLKPLYDKVGALNSNRTATEYQEILDGVKDGGINILYLSPELLLSHSLTSVIGERKLGLVVVDEAHTVTTWGRDFRVDYWFLGSYLSSNKKYVDKPFVIFALTATAVWDITRKNDMVFEIIDSLHMDPCIKYIGNVRRENISFDISLTQNNRAYERERNRLTALRISEAISNNQKAIFYFPFRSQAKGMIDHPDLKDVQNKITEFHSELPPEIKRFNANRFKTGVSPIICATKAFGMGIDVPDISQVYHHAPSGTLSDYIQEIGRLARDPEIKGIAKIDFNEQDFKYIRQLHGLSTIKPAELSGVLSKLWELYLQGGEIRNMMISPSDFAHIFRANSIVDIDQRLKSCLLLISNDLNRSRFKYALIVRPKNLFVNVFIRVDASQVKAFREVYSKYISTLIGCKNSFELDAEKFWHEQMNSLSFPAFKRKLVNGDVFKKFKVEVINKLDLFLNCNPEQALSKLKLFFDSAESLLKQMAGMKGVGTKHLRFSQVRAHIEGTVAEKEVFFNTFFLVYADKETGYIRVNRQHIYSGEDKEMVFFERNGFEALRGYYLKLASQFITSKNNTIYCPQGAEIIKLAEIINSLGIGTYQCQGGTDPKTFVRINNPNHIQRMVSRGRYINSILVDIYQKHRFAERIFSHFFCTEMSDKERWDFIELYFLGASEEELLRFPER